MIFVLGGIVVSNILGESVRCLYINLGKKDVLYFFSHKESNTSIETNFCNCLLLLLLGWLFWFFYKVVWSNSSHTIHTTGALVPFIMFMSRKLSDLLCCS